jgi:hypothetical protein
VALAQEAFVTGNAARITPVGSLTFRGSEKAFGDKTPGAVTNKLYRALIAVQRAQWNDRSLVGIPREILERWDHEWLYRVSDAGPVLEHQRQG